MQLFLISPRHRHGQHSCYIDPYFQEGRKVIASQHAAENVHWHMIDGPQKNQGKKRNEKCSKCEKREKSSGVFFNQAGYDDKNYRDSQYNFRNEEG